MIARRIIEAAQLACLLEVCAPKPGNVNRLHDFPDLHFEDFLLSAVAIGPSLENADQSTVGEMVYRAVQDTHQLVRTNTNLGIVLLLSPLVKTCATMVPTDRSDTQPAYALDRLRDRLDATLSNLTVEDARQVYAAIRLAEPGGMGTVSQEDIHAEPSVTLLEAMQLAKERDSVAGEYASGYQITFEIGLPTLRSALDSGLNLSAAIVQAYLTILAKVPDTLIGRKAGRAMACQASQWAALVLEEGGVKTSTGREAIAELDRQLRDEHHRLNPGASADLTAAAIFAHLVEEK